MLQELLERLRGRVSKKTATAFATLVAALAGATFVLAVDDTDHDGRPDHGSISVTLGGPGHEQVTLTPQAQAIVADQAQEDGAGDTAAAESDLHESVPPTAAAKKAAEEIKPDDQPKIPAMVPLATVHEPGCTTALVRNYSSRKGAPLLFGFIHWTGSQPTLGSPAGGLAIVHWFDTPASQASSNYITDQNGRCWLTVAESQKAWTQANANPWAVSVEITNQGVQPLFQTPAARATVIRLMRSWHRKWGIPYRHGIIRQGPRNSCIPVRSGFLAHRDAGACGGGHPDVGSFDVDRLIRDAAAGADHKDPRADASYDLKPLTNGETGAAKCLLAERRTAHRHHGWGRIDDSHQVRAEACKASMVRSRAAIKHLGLTSKRQRRARCEVLGKVIAGRP